MKTCNNCSFENTDDSQFCQECGEKLVSHNKTELEGEYVWTCDYCGKEFKTKSINDKHELTCSKNPDKISKTSHSTNSDSIYRKLTSDPINDVIFKPKKKENNWGWVVAIVGVIILFIYFIGKSYNDTNGVTIAQPTPTPYVNQYILLSNISVVDYKIKWIGNKSYFVGTMKNANSQHIKDIVIRIDFAWDKAMSQIFDTRYVTVNAVPSNGAFTFELPLNFYQTKSNWYQFKIESADTL